MSQGSRTELCGGRLATAVPTAILKKPASWFLRTLPTDEPKDLSSEFPKIKGFSHRNLKYMRQWVQFWSGAPAIGQQAVAQLTSRKGQQLVAQLPSGTAQLVSRIPWGHNLRILEKLNDHTDALFYVQKTHYADELFSALPSKKSTSKTGSVRLAIIRRLIDR